MNKIKREDRVGYIGSNKHGSIFTVIKYNSAVDVCVEFDNGYTKSGMKWGNITRGKITSPYCKTILNTGYIGEGKYRTSDGKKATDEYEVWRAMMNRCYGNNIEVAYKKCSVCEEWHNFQNFAKWYSKNYYTVDGRTMHLDKDILVKGNKVYSQDTCVFVPQLINLLFTKRKNDRGKYPIGVKLHKGTGKFEVGCNDNGKDLYLGLYNSIDYAFEVYKQHKEKVIKDIADKYKNDIPNKLYDALYNYEVEITD